MDNLKRRTFLKTVLGVAVAPLCLTKTAKAMTERNKAILIRKLRAAHKNTKWQPPLKARYCVIYDYAEAKPGEVLVESVSLPWPSKKLVRYIGRPTLRKGDRVWYVDGALTLKPGIEVDHLPMGRNSQLAGVVKVTPEEWDKQPWGIQHWLPDKPKESHG